MVKQKTCAFSTSDDGYAVSSAVSMLSVRKYKPDIDLFLIGRQFSEKTKKFLSKHNIEPIEINLEEEFHTSWDYPVECFYIFAGPELLHERGYTHSLYVDGDVYCNNDPLAFDLSTIKDFAGTFTDASIKAILDITSNDSDTAVKLLGNKSTLSESRIQTGIVYFNNNSLAKKNFLKKIVKVYQEAIENNIPRKGDDSLFALFRLAYPKWGWHDLGILYNRTTVGARLITHDEWLKRDADIIHSIVFMHFTNHTKPWKNTSRFPTYTHEYFYHAWRRHAVDTLTDAELAEYYPEIHSVLTDEHLRFYWYPTKNVGDLITPYYLEKFCGIENIKNVSVSEYGIERIEGISITNGIRSRIKYLPNTVRRHATLKLNQLHARVLRRNNSLQHGPSIPLHRAKYSVSTGSVIRLCLDHAMVFGSGIRDKDQKVHNSVNRIVRGPLTRQRFLESGYQCAPVYGDPGLLLPQYYKPKKMKKKYQLGIIPHFTEYDDIVEKYKGDKNVLIVDMGCGDLEKVIDDISSCSMTVSSSLHGLVISHAYGVPTRQIEYSDRINGDGTKFLDYYGGVGMKRLTPINAAGCKYISPSKLSAMKLELLTDYDDRKLQDAIFFDERGFKPSARYPYA